MYRIVLMCSLFGAVFSQSVLPGKCELPQTAQADVNIFALLGSFYQLHRIPNPIEQGDCSTTAFGIGDDFTGYIANSERLPNGTIHNWRGTIELVDEYTFRITYGSEASTYYVLATDNETYMIIYNCQDIPNADQKNVYAWVLSRTKTLSAAGIQGVFYVYQNDPEMKYTAWQITNQNNC